ncbi:hypothetical protein BGZ76_004933 [Entomortierella beljakovae]|nr:hypothetical protein BGZ76_004933 [Entomortierella beljakovae]
MCLEDLTKEGERAVWGVPQPKDQTKALMQPQFKYRRVLEERKTDDVHDMEASILPKKSVSDADLQNYTRSVINLKGLDDYYNSTFRHRRDTWDMKKARDARTG